VAGQRIRKETEPGAVGILMAVVEALEFVFRGKNIQTLTVGALAGDETLKVIAVS
jgi:hypothetical protein